MPRRGLALRPINSVKNIVDGTFIGVAASVTTNVLIGDGVNTYAGGTTEIPIGAKVRSVYLFFQIQPQAAQGNVDAFFFKASPTEATALLAVTPGVTGGSTSRRFILHEEKGIPGIYNNGASPHTFRGVLKIPRGRQRIGEGDKIYLRIRCSTAYDACVKVIYKFYQ